MSNENKITDEQAFSDWLDGDLAQSDLPENQLWQQRRDTVKSIEHNVEMMIEEPVPNWNRESTFQETSVTFWQWRGLPMLSMAFSIFAVALVLFKVELVVQNNGLLVNFGGNADAVIEEKVDLLVSNKLKDFAHEQQVVLANYASDIKTKQQESNLQLASYIMGAARQERKEDINDFIQYINAQRKDENLEHKIKYQQLEHAIKANATYQPIDINDLGVQQNSAEITPMVWNTEE